MGLNLISCSQETPSPSAYCRPYLGWGRSGFLRAVWRRGRWLCRGHTERVAVWHRSQETAAALPAWRSAAQGHLCNVQVIHCQFNCTEFMDYPNLNLHLVLTIWDNGGGLWRNTALKFLKEEQFGLFNVTRQLLRLGYHHYTQKNIALAKQSMSEN